MRPSKYCHRTNKARVQAAVTQYDDNLQATTQMFDGVLQASQHLATETITRAADDEKIIGALVEYKFDRNTRVRTAEHRRKRPWCVGCEGDKRRPDGDKANRTTARQAEKVTAD